MKKRILSFLFVVILAVAILPTYAAAAGSLSNFTKLNTYTAGQFKDVPSTQWYADEVQLTYEYNLFNGKTASSFAPDSNLSLSEAIKLAAVMHSIYTTGASTLSPGSPVWYQPYVDYALQNGIIPSNYSSYEINATRADFAKIFAAALPEEALPQKNTIADNTIPDVKISYDYGPSVYLLYRAGVLTGSPGSHAYNPLSNIKRAEVAAIVARMVSNDFREAFSIAGQDLTDTQIAAKCSPAVFYVELYDSTGTAFASGSGFFINSSGLAVTNFHVIDGAVSAKIMTTDGKVYDVTGVYDYSKDHDLALIQIGGSGFPYLELGDSSTVVTGATIYAIGSPKGLDNTFSKGVVSNASRKFSDSVVNYIQIDAAISHGSSGGALINTKGQVIGVTAAGREDAQNVNFAIPINLANELSRTNYVPLPATAPQTSNLSVTATPSAVSVAVGMQTTIMVTASSDNFDSVAFSRENPSVLSCTWGEWNGNSIPLTITGLVAGTSGLAIGLLDANDNVLAETLVNVTVTGSVNATTYYPGYYPVPDWGAFTGTPLDSKSPSGQTFFYKMSDVKVDADIGLDQYFAALEHNGFSFAESYYDDQGYAVVVYTNQVWAVFVGLADFSGTVYMAISVFPV